MKISMMMAVSAATLALVTTGCKYDKTGDEGAGAGDNGGNVSDISATTGTYDNGANSGSLDAIQGEKRFEDMYQQCTDVHFQPVYFGFDSTVVPQEELGKIDEVAQHLASNPSRVVVVEGNCDERGSNEYNLSLGENRAVIVRNYLVQNGIAAGRIQTRSYGEEKPADPGHDEAAWAKNRRDEFGIYDTNLRK